MINDDERAVLAHMVVDPEAWFANCLAAHIGKTAHLHPSLPQEAQAKIAMARARADLTEKVEKRRPEFEAAKAAQGTNYKTRAVREEEVQAVQRALDEEQMKSAAAHRAAQREEIIQEAMRRLRDEASAAQARGATR